MAKKISALGHRCVSNIIGTMSSVTLYRIADHECKIHKNKKACKQREKYADQLNRASYLLDKYCRVEPR